MRGEGDATLLTVACVLEGLRTNIWNDFGLCTYDHLSDLALNIIDVLNTSIFLMLPLLGKMRI